MSSHGLIVEFSFKPLKNEFKSNEAGREIWEDVEHVTIIIPGDRNTLIERIVEPDDKTKFALEYAAFKNHEKKAVVGTPLSEWAPMSRSLVKEFEYLHIHTVEHLADMSDTAKQAFGPGALQWCEKAKAFLASAKDSAAGQKYAADNAALRNEIAELKRQISEISAQAEKRGPGRPRKEQEEAA